MKIECNFISPLRRDFCFMSKSLLVVACFVFLGLAEQGRAIVINPTRCLADNIGEDNVARERNAWFEKCKPDVYETIFSEGSEYRMNGTQFERRVYVTFGVPDRDGGFIYPNDWKAPTDRNTGCHIEKGYRAIGVCVTGCYAPGQELLFSDGWTKVEEAASIKTQKRDLVTLSNNSTLENLSTRLSQIKNWIFDLRDAQ